MNRRNRKSYDDRKEYELWKKKIKKELAEIEEMELKKLNTFLEVIPRSNLEIELHPNYALTHNGKIELAFETVKTKLLNKEKG